MDNLNTNELTSEQPNKPCCRCPADNSFELDMEAQAEDNDIQLTTPPAWSHADDDDDDNQNTQQKRYVAPKHGACATTCPCDVSQNVFVLVSVQIF